MSISIEQFKLYFEPISKYNEDYERNSKALDMLYPSSYTAPELGSHLLDSYISILSDIMGDTADWISYYVFECNSGKKPMSVTMEDKTEIELDSIEKLYKIMTYETQTQTFYYEIEPITDSCLTPCKYFSEIDGRKIGSVRCQECKYMKYINREEQIVHCSRGYED